MRRQAMTVGLATIAVAGVHAAGASAAPSLPPPRIAAVAASPHALPAAGGTVTVTLRVRGATSCSVSGQPVPFAHQGHPRTLPCRGGSAHFRLHVAANPYQVRAPIHFRVTVHGDGGRFAWEQIAIFEAAPAPPPPPKPALAIGSTTLPPGTAGTAYQVSLSATGGTAPYAWAVSSGALPPGLALAPNGTISGVPTTAATATFAATVTDAASATAQASYTITIAPLPPPSNLSLNWSGYVVPSGGTPLSETGGSWTVPTLNCAATPNAGASTWVGIGGASLPDGTDTGPLLQTGIRTDCVDGAQQNVGWWEEVPGQPDQETDYESFAVSPGDTIVATVYQGSNGSWETKLDDVTTGLSGVMVTGEGWGVAQDSGDGSFPLQGSTAGLAYAGGTSADWIVEDYLDATAGADVPLASFGTVSFSNVTTSLSQWRLTYDEAVGLDLNGTLVSTPSPPSGNGFSVAYSG